ncbi:MAG: cupin domain-containing protein [Immundisolibacteraceae bacterium]|nr:cupin domain-containing protein [Immundisolibacteraceae bacterium]
MNINADLRQRAVIYSTDLDWVASPLAGVTRRQLERVGGENADRATTLVRYAPGSHFSPHNHDLGEEFLVLEGTFSDDSGDFPAGMYVRNPPGSRHQPSSEPGCTILVKLRQFDPDDQQFVRSDCNQGNWQSSDRPGLQILPLHSYNDEEVALQRLAAGARPEPHSHAGGEEIYVLDGEFSDEHGHYPAGTWLRQPPGSSHSPFSESGCKLYIKTGHLPAQHHGAN